MKESRTQTPKTQIVVLGIKCKTLYGLCQALRKEGNNITLRKLGEYLKEGMPHGTFMGQYIFSKEKEGEVALWLCNRENKLLNAEQERQTNFYGKPQHT